MCTGLEISVNDFKNIDTSMPINFKMKYLLLQIRTRQIYSIRSDTKLINPFVEKASQLTCAPRFLEYCELHTL